MMPVARLLSGFAALSLCAQASRAVYHRMLSLAGAQAPSGVRVGWTSGPGDVLGNGTSTVEYGLSPHALTEVALGANWSWVDVNNPFGGTNRSYTHHLVELPSLRAGATYFYRCGDPDDGWSSVASFSAPRAFFPPDAPLTVAVFGDLGWTNAQSLASLQDEALRGVDLFLALGDYGYNLEYRDGAVGDAFQSAMESITSTQMYQGVVGNHVRRKFLRARSSPRQEQGPRRKPRTPTLSPFFFAGGDALFCPLHAPLPRVCGRGAGERADARRAGHYWRAAQQPLLQL
jgi:hypothetical protein